MTRCAVDLLRWAVAACALLALTIALTPVGSARAQTAEPTGPAPVPGVASAPEAAVSRRAPVLDAASAVLVEPVTGDVVYRLRPHQRRPIASTTKLMTALLVLEREPLGRVFTSPGYHPAFPDESLVPLRSGERMTVADLLRGLLLASGNDAAVDLAANTTGSVASFVAQMNRRASQLGLSDTHYANPIGLDAAGNHSSASNLVALAIRLRQRRWFAHAVDQGSARLNGSYGARTVVNRNDLVRQVGFVNGVKTGHTPAAGYVLVGSGTRNGVTMVSAVLGDPRGVLAQRGHPCPPAVRVLAVSQRHRARSHRRARPPPGALPRAGKDPPAPNPGVHHRGAPGRAPADGHCPRSRSAHRPASRRPAGRARRRSLPRPRDRPRPPGDRQPGARGGAGRTRRDLRPQTRYPRRAGRCGDPHPPVRQAPASWGRGDRTQGRRSA